MNHLPDAGKMVPVCPASDTPRTDEACRAEHDGSRTPYVVSDFARILERELAAAQSRVKELEAKLEACGEAQRTYTLSLGAWIGYAERLEEACGEMHRTLIDEGLESDGQDLWVLAKETKP